MGKKLAPPLLTHVVRLLKDGCETLYQGGLKFLRNYGGPLKPEEEAKAVEKAEEAVRKGWAAVKNDAVGKKLAPPLSSLT